MAREWTEKHIRELIKAEMGNLDDGSNGDVDLNASIRKGLRVYTGFTVSPEVFAEGYSTITARTNFVGYEPQVPYPGALIYDIPIFITTITIQKAPGGFNTTANDPHFYISSNTHLLRSGAKMFFEYSKNNTKRENGEITYENIDTSLTYSSDIASLRVPLIVEGTMYRKDGTSTGIKIRKTGRLQSSIRVGSTRFTGSSTALEGYRFSEAPETGTYYVVTKSYYNAGSDANHPEKLKKSQFKELTSRADRIAPPLIERQSYTEPVFVENVDGVFTQAGAIFVKVGSKWEDAKPDGFTYYKETIEDN